jgi:hypothetical protein
MRGKRVVWSFERVGVFWAQTHTSFSHCLACFFAPALSHFFLFFCFFCFFWTHIWSIVRDVRGVFFALTGWTMRVKELGVVRVLERWSVRVGGFGPCTRFVLSAFRSFFLARARTLHVSGAMITTSCCKQCCDVRHVYTDQQCKWYVGHAHTTHV